MKSLIVLLLFWTTIAIAGITGDPFTGTPIQISAVPGSVTTWNAVDFDKGGEGIAYHDLTPGNCAALIQTRWCIAAYRLTEDVDIQAESDGTFNILSADAGEWLNYTIWVNAKEANYTIEVSVAIGNTITAPAYHLEIDGVAVTKSVLVGGTTGSFHTFEWRGKTDLFPLSPGKHVLQVVFDVPYFNLKSIRMKYAADSDIVWTGWGWVPIWRVYP